MNTLNHLAIIMDGNGRWAKQNKLPRTAGHYKGVEVLRNITIYANRLGIKCLTVYAFSTENWKRSADEVNYIMSLPKIFFASYIKELMENNVRVMIIGDRERIPAETMRVIDDAINTTRNNTGLILNFAFNYGARDEIVRAAKAYAKDYKDGKVSDLDEEGFASYEGALDAVAFGFGQEQVDDGVRILRHGEHAVVLLCCQFHAVGFKPCVGIAIVEGLKESFQ